MNMQVGSRKSEKKMLHFSQSQMSEISHVNSNHSECMMPNIIKNGWPWQTHVSLVSVHTTELSTSFCFEYNTFFPLIIIANDYDNNMSEKLKLDNPFSSSMIWQGFNSFLWFPGMIGFLSLQVLPWIVNGVEVGWVWRKVHDSQDSFYISSL